MIRKSTPSPQSPVRVVDQHRFDADADQDPTFHFDADHNPDSDPTIKQSQVNTVVDQFEVYIIGRQQDF
jgi:hypothetical protein